jgi:eukaryotic-like serine/threonine-protein kinase
MGTVFIVRDLGDPDGPPLALKRLRADLHDEERVRGLFVDEARVAALIRHPNVVRVLDVGEDADGPFIAMEFVDGPSLAALIEHHRALAMEIPIDLCVEIARQVACGLEAAHQATSAAGAPLDLVHRDVAPQNILIGFDGRVRVADFGIAKAQGRRSQTATGLLLGKAGYMAPEQLRFEPATARSDLFALGVVLFELTTGHRLYGDDGDGEGPRRTLNEPAPDLGELRPSAPVELVELLFELLAKSPESRPESAAVIATRLAEIHAELTDDSDGVTDLREYAARHLGELRRDPAALAMREASAHASVPDNGRGGRSSPARRWAIAWVGAGLLAAAAAVVWGVGSRNVEDATPGPAAGAIAVDELAPRWVTPNSVRWSWRADGPSEAFLRYELAVSQRREAVEAFAADVVWGPEHNPELGHFMLPRTSGDRVLATTTDGLEPDRVYYARLRSIDIRGQHTSTPVVAIRTPLAAARSIPIYSDDAGQHAAARDEYPPCLSRSDQAPYRGTSHYRYAVACDDHGGGSCGATSSLAACWENLSLKLDPIEIRKLNAGTFETAYLEVSVALDESDPAFWSYVAVETPSGRWQLDTLTMRADGRYRRYQLPLQEFAREGQVLRYVDLSAVVGVQVGGLWTNGGVVRIDEIHLHI